MLQGLLRLPLTEKFRTKALLGHGVIGGKVHRPLKSHERLSVVQQNLSCASEIGPRLGEVGPERYSLLQLRRGLFDLMPLATYFRPKIAWIGSLRIFSQELDGAVQVRGGDGELAGLNEN